MGRVFGDEVMAAALIDRLVHHCHLVTIAATATGCASHLLNVFDVAALVGCHEESVRRAYNCGQLRRRRFGVRGCRFELADVVDGIQRGAPTRPPRDRALQALDGPSPE